jgi:hypothetical protein
MIVVEEPQGGWLDGAPPSMPSEAVLADLLAYRKMKCPGCGKKGMKATPQHTEQGRYRIIASCHNCRYTEEC